jgi:phosphoribosylcarboxyaminoimidazole (NCAIR) mutase
MCAGIKVAHASGREEMVDPVSSVPPHQTNKQTMTPKMLKTADPTMVPMPKSVSVTKVPITLAKNSGLLVPVNPKKYHQVFPF